MFCTDVVDIYWTAGLHDAVFDPVRPRNLVQSIHSSAI